MNILYSLICNIPLIIMAILGLGFVIVFHEFGHFLFCKLFKVHTPSFSVGFGPRLIEKKIGDTMFAISAIPLGGYVEIAGSAETGQGEQLHAHDKGDTSFSSKPYWQKMLIISGGILFNIIFAYFALSFLFYSGAPCIGTWCNKFAPIIASVSKDSPAQKAGLQAQDKILAVDNQPIENISDFTKAIEPFANKQTTLKILRNNSEQQLEVQVGGQEVNGKTLPRLGVYWYTAPMSLGNAFKEGWSATFSIIAQIFNALKGLTKSREGLGGPLMLISQVTECAGLGFKVFLFMLAFISLNLAVFNVLPLPIFDGGQALFFTIEALTGKPLSDSVREKIHYYTWLLVIALVIYLTYKDILKIAAPYIEKLRK